MKSLTRITFALVAVAGLLGGCASRMAEPGTPRDQVLAAWGRPSAEITRGDVERLQYSRQPAGQTAVMVDVDTAGRVLRSFEALTLNEFDRIDVSGGATRDDIRWAFGRPASVDHVGSWTGDIWTYRWNNGQDMLFWVYFDPSGVVRRTQQGVDFLNIREMP